MGGGPEVHGWVGKAKMGFCRGCGGVGHPLRLQWWCLRCFEGKRRQEEGLELQKRKKKYEDCLCTVHQNHHHLVPWIGFW